jgi:nucleotide-binding universal stress UspA family protein
VTKVLVPVRFPLTETSRGTLESAVSVANERGANLTILHVNRSDLDHRVTRTMLKTAVTRAVGELPDAQFVVRQGPLVEQTILEEVAAEDVDIVVLGRKSTGIVGRLFRRVFDEPDVEAYIRERHDAEILTVSAD